jgi:hypothetical protein
MRTDRAVFDARCDAWVHPIKITVGRDDRRAALIVAVVDDLEEFFGRPRRRVLGPEVVEDEQTRVANLVEAVVIRLTLFWGEGRAQVIKEVGNDGEEWEGYLTLSDIIRDSRRQVRLPAAERARQQEPPIRILRVGKADLERSANARHVGIKVFERPIFEHSEAAQFSVVLAAARGDGGPPTIAVDRFAKEGVVERHVEPIETCPAADRAFSPHGGRARSTSHGGIFPVGRILQRCDFADLFHLRALRFPIVGGFAEYSANCDDSSLPLR